MRVRPVVIAATVLMIVSLTSTTIFGKTKNDPLAEFKVLPLPRADISIGSEWKDGVGPLGPGVDRGNIMSLKSLDGSQLETHSELRTSIVASVVKLLGLTGSGGHTAASKIKLGQLIVERVADVAALKGQPGRQYIWEGIRVAQFSLDNSVTNSGAVTANLQRFSPSLAIDTSINGTGGTTVSLTGANLFVAFRVVTFTPGPPRIVARRRLPHGNEVDLGTDYRLVFVTIPKEDSVWIRDNRFPQLMFPDIVKRSKCAGLTNGCV